MPFQPTDPPAAFSVKHILRKPGETFWSWLPIANLELTMLLHPLTKKLPRYH